MCTKEGLKKKKVAKLKHFNKKEVKTCNFGSNSVLVRGKFCLVQLQLLESENIDLRNILKLKQTKTFISNILRRSKTSSSMPDNLNTVDKKRMKGISLMRAFSKKKKPAVTVFKSRVNEDMIVEEDTTDPPHQHESIVSRW